LRAAVAQGLGDVQAAHAVGAVEIGQRARDTERAMPGAGGQAETLGGAGQQGAAPASGWAIAAKSAPSVPALQRGLDQPRAMYDPPPEARTLAERVEAKRRRLGVTFDQIAGYLGWDPATLTRYLNGTWRIPANRMAALELLLSVKSTELTEIHRLPRRPRRSGRSPSN
jgi:hypothetical protein